MDEGTTFHQQVMMGVGESSVKKKNKSKVQPFIVPKSTGIQIPKTLVGLRTLRAAAATVRPSMQQQWNLQT